MVGAKVGELGGLSKVILFTGKTKTSVVGNFNVWFWIAFVATITTTVNRMKSIILNGSSGYFRFRGFAGFLPNLQGVLGSEEYYEGRNPLQWCSPQKHFLRLFPKSVALLLSTQQYKLTMENTYQMVTASSYPARTPPLLSFHNRMLTTISLSISIELIY